jgi:hypothetical protein
MSVRYDAKQEAIWTSFKPTGRPCFSLALLKESKSIQKSIIGYLQNGFSELASDTVLNNENGIAMHKHLGFVETERILCFIKKLE